MLWILICKLFIIFSRIVIFSFLSFFFSFLVLSFSLSINKENLIFINSSNCLSCFFLYISYVFIISSSWILFIFFGFTLTYILSTSTIIGFKWNLGNFKLTWILPTNPSSSSKYGKFKVENKFFLNFTPYKSTVPDITLNFVFSGFISR